MRTNQLPNLKEIHHVPPQHPHRRNAPEASKPLLAAVKKQLGVVPNLMKLVGHSPAALEGYLSLNGALAKGARRQAARMHRAGRCRIQRLRLLPVGPRLPRPQRRQAERRRYRCGARRPFPDPRTNAVLQFARRVAETRGSVSDTDIAALRAAGIDEAGKIEIVVTWRSTC